MPVPKRKRSRARRDSRFANKFIKVKTFGACPSCNEPILPHIACRACGHYKGTKVLTPKSERAAKRSETRSAQVARAKAAQATAASSEKAE